MEDTLWELVQNFVIVMTAIEKSKKLSEWLKKLAKFFKGLNVPRKRRLK